MIPLDVNSVEKALSNPGQAAAYVTGAAALGGTAFKAFVKVKRGEMGVRTHLGRPEREKDSLLLYQSLVEPFLNPKRKLGLYAGQLYGIVSPGIHPVVPFTHSIEKVGVLPRLNELKDFKIMDDDSKVLDIMAYISWNVRPDSDNPYKALFKVEGGNLEQAVSLKSVEKLREVLLDREDIHKVKSAEIQDHMQQLSRTALSVYGVDLLHVGIIGTTATGAGQIAEAMRDMKVSFTELMSNPGALSKLPESAIPFQHSFDVVGNEAVAVG